MAENKEPILISSKGELNTVLWSAWFRANNPEMTALHAQYAFNERIQNLPEPNITTSSGKISAIWVKWYRIRKRVSTNVAVAVARRRINAESLGKKPLEEHLTVWW